MRGWGEGCMYGSNRALILHTYIKKVKLIRIRRPDARREKQQIPLLPRDLEGRELETHAGTLFAHDFTLTDHNEVSLGC